MTAVYFSGTGNTKFCTEKFCGQIGCTRLFSIEDSSAVSSISESGTVIFAYPIYYSSLPKIVGDFIKNNSSLWKGKKIFIIATMGLFSGDGAGVSARLFKKFGAEILGGLHIKMPDCIGDVKALKASHEKNLETINAALQKISNAAVRFKNKNPTREGLNFAYHMAGFFGQRLYFYSKTKNYTVGSKNKTRRLHRLRKMQKALSDRQYKNCRRQSFCGKYVYPLLPLLCELSREGDNNSRQ